MKTVIVGWMGLLFLSLQIGCCSVCPDNSCGAPMLHGGLGSRLAGIHCRSGCGEVYWDEQINEPRTCDPCGYGGEFVGGGSCGTCPGAISRFRQLLGFPYVPSDCSTCSMGACDSCGGYEYGGSGCASCQSGGHYAGESYSHEGVTYPQETVRDVHIESSRPSSTGGVPTPAPPRAAPAPTPDANSMHRAPRKVPATVAVGSGVRVQNSRR